MNEENYHITKVTTENIHEVAKLFNGKVFVPGHVNNGAAIVTAGSVIYIDGSVIYIGSYIVVIDDTYLVLSQQSYLECLQETEGMLMKRKDLFLDERWVGFGGYIDATGKV